MSGDADAAAYKYYGRREYQDLHNSSFAIMLIELQREVHTKPPCENRLRTNYSPNIPSSQLNSASDLDCCFMAVLSWRKPAGPRIMRKNTGATRVSKVKSRDQWNTTRTLKEVEAY